MSQSPVKTRDQAGGRQSGRLAGMERDASTQLLSDWRTGAGGLELRLSSVRLRSGLSVRERRRRRRRRRRTLCECE